MAPHILLLPGIGNSGPEHWQRLWAGNDPRMSVLDGQDWDQPTCSDWVANLDDAVRRSGPDTVLVAHSLGCLQLVHWAQHTNTPVRAAMLVAVPDPRGPAFPSQAQGFDGAAMQPLRLPSVLVASSDDPYSSLDYSRQCAEVWGSRFVEVGPCGHINAASGLEEWPQGRALLQGLIEATSG